MEKSVENQKAIDNPEPAPETASSKGFSLDWRVAVAVVAVLGLGVLLYPLFQSNPADSPATVSAPASAQAGSSETAGEANSAQAQFELGNQYYAAGQWSEAEAAYQRAIELNPEYQGAYANLGVTYYQQQKFDLAAAQYQKALELNPQDGEVAYNLGALYLQQALSEGNGPPDPQLLDQAVAQLQQALELSPDLAEPYFTLGVAYFFQNQTAEAIAAFEQFKSLNPDESSQAEQEADRYLQQLRPE